MRGNIFVLIFITKICKYLCGLWEFVQLAMPLRKQGGVKQKKKTRKTRRKGGKTGGLQTCSVSFMFSINLGWPFSLCAKVRCKKLFRAIV